jgi:hypothetical protein
MQVLLVNAPKTTQIGPQCRASALAGIAVDLAAAIAIIIPRPLMHTMTDCGMTNMAKASFTPVGNCADSCGRYHLEEQQLQSG